MEIDGPDANAANGFQLVYRATTDQYGNVNSDQLQLRGANTSYAAGSPDVTTGLLKGVWYHVSMAVDFAHGTATATVQAAGSAPWTSGAVTGFNSGNSNILVTSGNSPFYLDNVLVDQGLSPSDEGTVTIRDGQSSATITVTPASTATVAGKSVQIGLAANAGYRLGAANQGVVTIAIAATRSQTQVVLNEATQIGVASIGSSLLNPTVYGQPVRFTAAVATTAPGGRDPTGSVQLSMAPW